MGTAVTGIGIISPVGTGVRQCMEALKAGKPGISPLPRILSTSLRLPVGEIPLTNEELTAMVFQGGCPGVSETVSTQDGGTAPGTVSTQDGGTAPGTSVPTPAAKTPHLPRTALLGIIAAREALADAALPEGLRTAFVNATTVGGMDLTEHFFTHYMDDPSRGRLRDVRMHDCGSVTDAIARYSGINGYTACISTACSSAANAMILAAHLIECDIADCVVAGGTDALSAFTLNGFNSLKILDSEPCRPFDESRAGLNLGEGAGFIVLQRDDTLTKAPYCRLSGFSNRNDAHHQTASSENGDGAFLSMSDALAMAGNPIPDYINAHGTGTPNNDLSESRAMARLFGENVPPFSSTKSFTGHTLAAAGGIEAVFSVLSIAHGIIWPNLRFQTPITGAGLIPETSLRQGENISCVLSNSFGFGGNCTSLVFTKE